MNYFHLSLKEGSAQRKGGGDRKQAKEREGRRERVVSDRRDGRVLR